MKMQLAKVAHRVLRRKRKTYQAHHWFSSETRVSTWHAVQRTLQPRRRRPGTFESKQSGHAVKPNASRRYSG